MVASMHSLQAQLQRGSTYTITRVSGAGDQPQWLVTDDAETTLSSAEQPELGTFLSYS
jgi:hypothetical protein